MLRESIDVFAELPAKYNAGHGIRSDLYEPDSEESEYVYTTHPPVLPAGVIHTGKRGLGNMSIDANDPETWTGSYVTSNRRDCLITLQAHNLMARCWCQTPVFEITTVDLHKKWHELLIMQVKNRMKTGHSSCNMTV